MIDKKVVTPEVIHKEVSSSPHIYQFDASPQLKAIKNLPLSLQIPIAKEVNIQ